MAEENNKLDHKEILTIVWHELHAYILSTDFLCDDILYSIREESNNHLPYRLVLPVGRAAATNCFISTYVDFRTPKLV